MKTLFKSILLFFLMTFCFSFSSTLKAQVKAKEIVFVLEHTDIRNAKKVQRNKEMNAALKEVVEKYWNLDMNYKLMERKAAYKYAKSSKGIVIGEFCAEQQINGIRAETTFDIMTAKTHKTLLSVRLPNFGLSKADMVYAVMHGQFMYRNLTKFKNPSKELPKVYGHILKKKTLLIASTDITKKFTESDLKRVYPYEYKIVDYDEIKAAIINRDEDHVVLYQASEAGNVTEANYPYWNIYQPNDGVVITRHAGSTKGLSKADVELFVKRTK